MAKQQTNPFVLPGFGQSGDMAQNPLLASMEMMRSAWEGLAKVGGLDAVMPVNTSTDELERRIADLRTVEHWLQMNLSMLSSTIQALEVQRATVATLNNFLSSAAGMEIKAPLSPLDIALGINRAADSTPEAKSELKVDPVATAPSGDSTGLFGTPLGGGSAPSEEQPKQSDASQQPQQQATAAMQGWWDMLQSQFDNLADATAATLKGAENIRDATIAAQQKVAENMPVAPVIKKAATRKAAVKKSAVKKASIKKAAVKKTAAKKAAASKAAVKKSAAKKASAKKAALKKS